LKVYPTLNQVWVSASTGPNTTNDSIFVYDYVLQAWQCVVPDRAANILCSSIDSRGSPKHPILMLSGDYGGFVYEHDTGTTNAQNADGHIDGYGTALVLFGADSRDFIPRTIRACYDAQTSGQLQVGWGFNALSDISYTTIVSESQVGFLLDSTFYLDISTLAGSATLFTQVPVTNSGKCFTMQVQFRNMQASQPISVHPFYLSDERMI
jgi:hypothetical protein